MGIQLKNNASGTLATAISASDTGIVLTTGNGASFPALGAGDYFYATLESTGGTFEVIKVTVRSGDSMTVVRAQEGSIANSFAAGSRIELRVTGAAVTDFTQAGAGAVVRNFRDKLRETVSVKDFGAVGDGITDDTAAIQAAIDSANSIYVEFTNGNYLVTGLVASNKTFVHLQSVGATLTLKATLGTATAVAPVVNASQTTTIIVDGFKINGNKANQKNLAEANRGDGTAISTDKCINIVITNNHIYDNTAGAAVLCSQGGPEGSPGVVVSNYCLIDKNIIERCGQRPANPPTVASSDAIFCCQNNAIISNNKLYDFNDVGIAHDFSRNQQIINNFIDGQGVGIQGIACFGSAYVEVISNIIQSVGRGIVYFDQGNAAFSCERFNIASNDLRGIKNPDVPGGNDDCITVIQTVASAYFKIIGNTCGGGDNSIVAIGTFIQVENNDCFSPLDRPLSASGQYLTIRDNRFVAPNPAFIDSAKDSLIDVRENTTSYTRQFSKSATNPAYARVAYVKTDNTTNIRACLVRLSTVTSTGLVSVVTFKVFVNAGTATITTIDSYGDTATIEAAVSQNGTSRVEVLVRPSAGSFDFTSELSVMCPVQTNTFYITEA